MAEVLAPRLHRWRTLKLGGVVFDVPLLILISLGVMMPMLWSYGHGPFGQRHYDQLFFFFARPILVIMLVFREWPSAYGLRIGRWREGLIWLAVTYPLITLALWFVIRDPQMKRWYQGYISGGVGHIVWQSGVEMFGWEFIWRGFWLFGLARVIGPGPAILIQAVPFAILHFGKPEVETITTMFGGAGFGFVAWRCQSFLYAWLIHWFMLVAVIALALYT